MNTAQARSKKVNVAALGAGLVAEVAVGALEVRRRGCLIKSTLAHLLQDGASMIKNAQHVFPSSGRWAVRRTGAERASRLFATRSEAIRHARVIARKEHAELYIHKKDGTVMSMDSYAEPSSTPKGKK